MPRQQGSSFDPELFEEVQKSIAEIAAAESTPDLEAHILGEAAQTEEDKNLLNAQFCYEFMNHPLWPLFVKSLTQMVDREHKKFEDAERDPEDHLRRTWKAYQKVVDEIIGNVESAAELYRSSVK